MHRLTCNSPDTKTITTTNSLAVPASAPPAELLGSDERIPLATATPVPSSKGATDPLRLHTPVTAGDGGGGGGSYYQKEDTPEYPPARIRNISSYTANYASAPPAPGGEEDEEEAAMAAAAAAVGDGRPRVLLDVPLPPKGAEPRDLWAAVAFLVMACLLATVAVRLGLPALGVWEAELGGSSSSSYRYSEGTVAAARAVLGVAVGLALAGGVLAMAGLHLMLHWSGGACIAFVWMLC